MLGLQGQTLASLHTPWGPLLALLASSERAFSPTVARCGAFIGSKALGVQSA